MFCVDGHRLDMTDPFDRQITIGLGCFLELARQGAAAHGLRLELEVFPAGEPDPRLDDRPIAIARLVADSEATPDPLFGFVSARRTNREPFDTAHPLHNTDLKAISAAAAIEPTRFGSTIDGSAIAALRNLAWRAMAIEMETPRTYQESTDLMRIGKSEIEAYPDGISIGGLMPDLMHSVGLLTAEAIADPESSAFAQGMTMLRDGIMSSMGLVWITTPGNSRADQIDAGRDWVRLNLATTMASIALQPLSQALQEYPEMVAARAEIENLLGIAQPSRLQMFGRLGFGNKVDPSPRWPGTARLVEV